VGNDFEKMEIIKDKIDVLTGRQPYLKKITALEIKPIVNLIER
jgi:hypothetical protein